MKTGNKFKVDRTHFAAGKLENEGYEIEFWKKERLLSDLKQ